MLRLTMATICLLVPTLFPLTAALAYSDGITFLSVSELPEDGRFFFLNLDEDPALECVALSGRSLAIMDASGSFDYVTNWTWSDTDLPLASYALDIDGDGMTEVVVHRGQRFNSVDAPHGSGQYFVIETGLPADIPLDNGLRGELKLEQLRPEPFQDDVGIDFALSNPDVVTIRILDVTGRLVRSVSDGQAFDAGTHHAVWDGRDARGEDVPSGAYFVQLSTDRKVDSRRITLLR